MNQIMAGTPGRECSGLVWARITTLGGLAEGAVDEVGVRDKQREGGS